MRRTAMGVAPSMPEMPAPGLSRRASRRRRGGVAWRQAVDAGRGRGVGLADREKPVKRSRIGSVPLALLLVVSLAACAGGSPGIFRPRFPWASQAQATPVSQTAPPQAQLPAPGASRAPMAEDAIARIAANGIPGVVQITNEQQVLQPSGERLVPAGVGTGFVIDN